MNLGEYKPKLYLLIELPYSKIIMNHPEAIELEKPIGAFIVPEDVWLNIKAESTLNEMKQSGELVSTFAADGTEWFDCPSLEKMHQPIFGRHISTSSKVYKPVRQYRTPEWDTMRDDGLKIEMEEGQSQAS